MRSKLKTLLLDLIACGDDESKKKKLLTLHHYDTITLAEVAEVFMEMQDDLVGYTDVSQALQELRLIAVIKQLPEDIQEKIKTEFKESGDDLLEQMEEN
jgi:hypothetical protein